MRDPNFRKGHLAGQSVWGNWRFFWSAIFNFWRNFQVLKHTPSQFFQCWSGIFKCWNALHIDFWVRKQLFASLSECWNTFQITFGELERTSARFCLGYVTLDFEARMATVYEKFFVKSLWGAVRLGAGVAAAGHKSLIWTFSGSQSCPAVVRMFCSSISALFWVFYRFPTRPDGRAVDPTRILNNFWWILMIFSINFGVNFEGLDRPLELDCDTGNVKIHGIFQLIFQRFVRIFLSAMKTVIFAFPVYQSGWTVHFWVDF